MTFRYLDADEVECRVSQCSDKGVSLLLYKDARTDMKLLDETFGQQSWQCDYKSIDGKLCCGIGVKFDSEWVWKWDTGTESNMEAQKGEFSDAFKRAGFKWGIGRELYTAPRIWVGSDKCRIVDGRNGKKQCYDLFSVTDMSVEDGRIVGLTIANMSKRGAVVFRMPNQSKADRDVDEQEADAEQPKADAGDKAAQKVRMWKALSRWAELHGRTPEDVLEGVKKRPEWSDTAEFFASVADDFEADIDV